MKQILIALSLIVGMNFAYAANSQQIKIDPIPVKDFESNRSLTIAQTAFRCGILFKVAGEGRYDEKTLREVSMKFLSIAFDSKLGLDRNFVNAIGDVIMAQYVPAYTNEMKNPESKVLKEDIFNCPYLLHRFNR